VRAANHGRAAAHVVGAESQSAFTATSVDGASGEGWIRTDSRLSNRTTPSRIAGPRIIAEGGACSIARNRENSIRPALA
jgi:hypothetical protein